MSKAAALLWIDTDSESEMNELDQQQASMQLWMQKIQFFFQA
jgi:hypothetical protein